MTPTTQAKIKQDLDIAAAALTRAHGNIILSVEPGPAREALARPIFDSVYQISAAARQLPTPTNH